MKLSLNRHGVGLLNQMALLVTMEKIYYRQDINVHTLAVPQQNFSLYYSRADLF